MDKVTQAQKLIQLGTELNKPELVRRGQEMLNEQQNVGPKESQFIMSPLSKGSVPRVQYDEEGNIIKTYTRSEPVGTKFKNKFVDTNDEHKDKANEQLKKFTKHTPRERNKTIYKDTRCVICGKIEKVHPIHLASNTNYRCVNCLKNRR